MIGNKFVRTKMRLKLGTKIDLSERFVRLICQVCQILFSNDSMSFPRDFRDSKKNARRTDRPRTDHGRTDRPSYRDALTHLKTWILSSMRMLLVNVCLLYFQDSRRIVWHLRSPVGFHRQIPGFKRDSSDIQRDWNHHWTFSRNLSPRLVNVESQLGRSFLR